MRKMIGIVALSAMALAMLTAPATAQTGPDYIFNVPVRIENTPPLNGQRANVLCLVIAYDFAAGRPTGTYQAQQWITIGPSGFNDTVRVEITLPPGVRRADTMSWSCSLNLQNVRDASGASVPIPPGVDRGAAYTSVTGQRVASSRTVINGQFFEQPR